MKNIVNLNVETPRLMLRAAREGLHLFILVIVFIFSTFEVYAADISTKNIDLYPSIKASSEGYLKVSDIHSIWYAEYGNSKGIPIVFLHGGPGSGTSPRSMRYFNPKFYRIILLDQRGAGRSKPYGETKENTTALLINDLESLRKHLKVDKWVVFGGSWGTTLAIAYGEAHPNRCLGFILRGIFLASNNERDGLFYSSKEHFPEAWQAFNDYIPSKEQTDLLTAYYNRIMDPKLEVSKSAAYSFLKYDGCCETLQYEPKKVEESLQEEKDTLLGVARIYINYCKSNFFLEENELMNNLHKIIHLPAIIINGRYDTLCRSNIAFDLHKKWSGSELWIAENSGHSAGEPEIKKALILATDKMRKIIELQPERE